MSCFLFSNDEETNQKVNIDELYEKNQRRDLKQLSIFKFMDSRKINSHKKIIKRFTILF